MVPQEQENGNKGNYDSCLMGLPENKQLSQNKAYPKRNLAQDCRYLNLAEFLASHEAT